MADAEEPPSKRLRRSGRNAAKPAAQAAEASYGVAKPAGDEEALEQVVSLLQSGFQCAICQGLVVAPHVLSCSHRFCGCCILEWTGRENDTCPTCRAEISGAPTFERGVVRPCSGAATVCRETLTFPPLASCAQDELLAAVSTRLPREEVEERALRQLDWLKRGGPGAVESLVAVLRANVAFVAVQERGLIDLFFLVCDQPAPSPQANAEADEQFRAAVRTFNENPFDAARRRAPVAAMYASSLLHHNAENVAKGTAAGAVEVLAAIMRTHLGSSIVQLAGCRLLSVFIDPCNHLARAAAAGADLALVDAMRAHPTNEQVHTSAGGAMMLLVGSYDKALQARLGAAGAYDVVLAWMRARQSVAADQKMCCSLLMLLSFDNAANIAKAVAAGAIPAVVNAMRLHESNLQVQVSACLVLFFLAMGDVDSRRAWRRTDGLFEAVVAAMRAHAADMMLQATGCMAILFLTRNAASRTRALAAGAVEAIDAAASAHADNESVQQAAKCARAALRGESDAPRFLFHCKQ